MESNGRSKWNALLWGGLFVALLAWPAQANFSLPPDASPEERGLAVAVEADKRDEGFENFASELMMVLRNRHGEESEWDMHLKTLEVADDGDKSLVVFDTPRDVKGTAFLSYSHKTGSDDQWLYLPALKRTKRIASNNKSGPFMGSEFAYEDISSQEVEKYTYGYKGEETLGEQATFVIERFPVDKNSGYTRQVVWIDQDEFRVWKVEFYDRKDQLLKTLELTDYREYEDRFWRAHRLAMVNHQTGKSTSLTWADYAFQTGLTDRDFDQSALRRAR